MDGLADPISMTIQSIISESPNLDAIYDNKNNDLITFPMKNWIAVAHVRIWPESLAYLQYKSQMYEEIHSARVHHVNLETRISCTQKIGKNEIEKLAKTRESKRGICLLCTHLKKMGNTMSEYITPNWRYSISVWYRISC